MDTAVSPPTPPLPSLPLDIEEELKESYLNYAMSVIISRALPDIRDGLKPSQRRILVAMRDLGLNPGSSTSKCAGIVGETMKRYHPHGDNSIYPTLARMGQWWNMRHLLITGQGNFGSIHGLPPAAMRYTEAKLSPVAAEMLEDIQLDTVDFQPNYDEKYQEPRVLPGKFPNLLVNGAGGIAVGMATSIPPHNLGEVCDALIAYIDDPSIDLDAIMELLPGPDFPTGATVCGRMGIKEAYLTGRGRVILRAKYEIDELKDGRARSASPRFRTSLPRRCYSRIWPISSMAAGSPACPTSTTSAIASNRCESWSRSRKAKTLTSSSTSSLSIHPCKTPSA